MLMPVVSPVLCASPALLVYRLSKSVTPDHQAPETHITPETLGTFNAVVFANVTSTSGSFPVSQLESIRSGQRNGAAHRQVTSIELPTPLGANTIAEERYTEQKSEPWDLRTIDEKNLDGHLQVLEASDTRGDDSQSQTSSDSEDVRNRNISP